MTLTVWLPDSFVSYAPDLSSSMMERQLTDFASNHPDTYVTVRLKRASGAGGLLDLLRTASPVAPSALPDVAVLNLTDMQTAARLGIVQPLDSWLATGLIEDFFPFATSSGQVDGKWYGMPYAVDLEHMAYDTREFTATVPLTWTQIVSEDVSYLFPMGSTSSVLPNAVVVQYMANGGTLTDARGQPMLDEAPLADTLAQFLEAYQTGVIPPDALRFTSTDETWPIFLAGQASLCNVRASQYLTVEKTVPWLGYAPLPARTGPARPLARGWSFVLITRDPARQPRAASLIMWMLAADNSAAWTQSVGLLPTRHSALDQWVRTDPYIVFLRQELGRALALPPANVMTIVAPVFQRALSDVLAGKATPQDAASAAMAQLKGVTP
jgi:multiple sugar transport system substrate-binding protein